MTAKRERGDKGATRKHDIQFRLVEEISVLGRWWSDEQILDIVRSAIVNECETMQLSLIRGTMKVRRVSR
jgi:hypothetical protein